MFNCEDYLEKMYQSNKQWSYQLFLKNPTTKIIGTIKDSEKHELIINFIIILNLLTLLRLDLWSIKNKQARSSYMSYCFM